MSILGLARAAARRTPEPELILVREALTPRERDVCRLIAQGLEIKEIARELGIGYHTVQMHIHGAKGKLGARNQLEIVILMHGGRPRSQAG